METIASICLGIGLSAACGFRVFVPLLMMSLAGLSGHIHPAPGFEWIGSYPALVAFSVATCLEIAAYYIPWVDHLLDTIASPAAVIAGILVSASLFTDVSPFLRWTLAIIAGGGAAGLVQGTTVMARGASGISTAGLANPIVSTVELAGAILTSLLTLIAPVLAVLLMAMLLLVLGLKWFRSHRPQPGPAKPGIP